MQSVLNRVVECVAITTRYPRQLLVPEADLENDLGIDSVKRVEIVAALAEEFGLDLGNKERDPSVRTIQQVATWIEAVLQPQLASHTPNASQDRHLMSNVATQGPVPAHHAPRFDSQSRSVPHFASRDTANGVKPHSRLHSAIAKAHTLDNGNSRIETPQTGLTGRVALVTGSGRGVGRTIARVLAARGVTVVINSFHSRDLGEQTTAEINATGGKAIHIWGSVAIPDHVDNMFAQIEQQIGHLDMLICNASDGRIGSFAEISQEDWDRAFRTNVSGHHQCAMRSSKLMQLRGGGCIVTMSSIGAHRYVEGLGGQGVVKAAVESLTRYLACELAVYGIRANCVSGGPIYGEVMSHYPDARSTHNYWESIVPDGELCIPMDLANTIAFLVSDEARAINGAIWTVDHGASTRAHSRPLPIPVASECHPPTYV